MRLLLCALAVLMLSGCVVYPHGGYYRGGRYNTYSSGYHHHYYRDHDRYYRGGYYGDYYY